MEEDRRSLQIIDKIKWPRGKHPDKFRNIVKKHKHTLLHGRIIAIDPASGSSSMPGWALFEAGELVAMGTIELNARLPIQGRLNMMFAALSNGIGQPPPDLLIMEEIRGRMAHAFLFWACGVIAAAFSSSALLELPVSFWRAILPEGYTKADDTDAAYIGLSAILLAKELHDE